MDNYFKSYSLEESKQLEMLMDLRNGIFSQDHYVDSISYYDPIDKQHRTMLTTNETVIILNSKKIEIVRYFAVEELRNIRFINSKDNSPIINETSSAMNESGIQSVAKNSLVHRESEFVQRSDSKYDYIELTIEESFVKDKINIFCEDKEITRHMIRVLTELRQSYITRDALGGI